MLIITRIARIIFTQLCLMIYTHALVKIDINAGVVDPIPYAFVNMKGSYGALMMQVINNDLENTGLFKNVDKNLDGQLMTNPEQPDFSLVGKKHDVFVQTKLLSDGPTIKIQLYAYDVEVNQPLINLALEARSDNWRTLAHTIADRIYEKLTGDKGYFNSKVAFVAETGPKTKRVKRIAVMDYDGANLEYLTNGQTLALTPRVDPTGRYLLYLSFYNNTPQIRKIDLTKRTDESIGSFEGLSFAPNFSPDGKKIIFSIARNGNTEIYTINLVSGTTKQLTFNAGIDTSPSFSPDGTKIVFNSDRDGSQQLYTMNEDGTNVVRITRSNGRYATPVWNQRGDMVAFTKILKGSFYIGVMSPNGTNERILTESFLDEAPVWSPNGRLIAFFRQRPGALGNTKLYNIDFTGREEKPFNLSINGSDPYWFMPVGFTYK